MKFMGLYRKERNEKLNGLEFLGSFFDFTIMSLIII